MSYAVGNALRSQLPPAKDVTKDIIIPAQTGEDYFSAVNQPIRYWQDAYAEFWRMTKTLMAGTYAMREEAEHFLPKEAAESRGNYERRLKRSTLFGAFRETVTSSTGRPFSRPIAFTDFDKQLLEINENIDLQGNNIDVFAREVFKSALAHGHAFILIDFPKRPDLEGRLSDLPSLEVERTMGLRPYWRLVPAYSVIGWKSEIRGGLEIPIQIRIRESADLPVGRWGVQTAERVRLLEPGRYELYEKNIESGKWGLLESGAMLGADGLPLDFIPIVPYYAGEQTGFFKSQPRFLDLAYMNVQHWQSQSDQDNLLHVARVPILFGTGFHDDDDLEIGSSRWIKGPEGATLSYVEHSGAAINAGRQSLEDLENRMRIMGAEILVRDPAKVTATQKIIDTEEATSDLQNMVIMYQDVLEQAYTLTVRWLGLDDSAVGDISIFRDFGVSTKDFQEANILLQARQALQISQETFLSELKRRGILSEDLDVQDEILLVGDETPEMPAPVADSD